MSFFSCRISKGFYLFRQFLLYILTYDHTITIIVDVYQMVCHVYGFLNLLR